MFPGHMNIICPDCNHVAKPDNECTTCRSICAKCLNSKNNIAFLFPNAVCELAADNSQEREVLAQNKHTRCHRERLIWRCLKDTDHPNYLKSPYEKLVMRRGCPICYRNRRTTNQELRMLAELIAIFPDTIHQAPIPGTGFIVDALIKLTECSVILEWDGYEGHGLRPQPEKEQLRHDILTNLGYKVVRIRDDRLATNELGIVHYFTNHNESSLLRAIHHAIKTVVEMQNVPLSLPNGFGESFLDEDGYQRLCTYKEIPDFECSLASDERLVNQYSRKNVLTPEQVCLGSNQKYWFTCGLKMRDCEDLHRISPKDAARTEILGCTSCVNTKKSLRQQKSQLERVGSFAANHPELLPGWDKENELNPNEVPYGSSQRITYNCLSCHTPNDTTISNISGVGSGLCFECGNKKAFELRRKSADKVADVRPDLVSYWLSQMNPDTPFECPIGIRNKRWMTCRNPECSKAYERRVNTLIRGKGLCEQCSKSQVILRKHSRDYWLKYEARKKDEDNNE